MADSIKGSPEPDLGSIFVASLDRERRTAGINFSARSEWNPKSPRLLRQKARHRRREKHSPSLIKVNKRKKGKLSPRDTSPSARPSKRNKRQLSSEPEDTIVLKALAKPASDIHRPDQRKAAKSNSSNVGDGRINEQAQQLGNSGSLQSLGGLRRPDLSLAARTRNSTAAGAWSTTVDELNASDANSSYISEATSSTSTDEGNSYSPGKPGQARPSSPDVVPSQSQDPVGATPADATVKKVKKHLKVRQASQKILNTPYCLWRDLYNDIHANLNEVTRRKPWANSAFFPTSKEESKYRAANIERREQLDKNRKQAQQRFLRERLALLGDVIRCNRRFYIECQVDTAQSSRREYKWFRTMRTDTLVGLINGRRKAIGLHKFYAKVNGGLKPENAEIVPPEVSQQEMETYDPGEQRYFGDFEKDELVLA